MGHAGNVRVGHAGTVRVGHAGTVDQRRWVMSVELRGTVTNAGRRETEPVCLGLTVASWKRLGVAI